MRQLMIAVMCTAAWSAFAAGEQKAPADASRASIGSEAVTTTTLPAARAATRVTADSSVYIEPTDNGMHTALAGALRSKKVPVMVVTKPAAADFIIRVTGDYKRAGWARTIMAGGYARGDASASMSVEHRESGTIVYAYNVEKDGARKGIQSAAEACAKHLKNHIAGKE